MHINLSATVLYLSFNLDLYCVVKQKALQMSGINCCEYCLEFIIKKILVDRSQSGTWFHKRSRSEGPSQSTFLSYHDPTLSQTWQSNSERIIVPESTSPGGGHLDSLIHYCSLLITKLTLPLSACDEKMCFSLFKRHIIYTLKHLRSLQLMYFCDRPVFLLALTAWLSFCLLLLA